MTEKTFETQLAGYIAAVQAKTYANLQYDVLWNAGYRTKIEVNKGPKYIRIVSANYNNPKNPEECTNRSSHTFIDQTNGNVLKAATWKAPELKNPRSNIFDDDFGASGITHHGAIYLPVGAKKKVKVV